MPIIYRDIESKILDLFSRNTPKGLILGGIIGSGKTTLVKHALEKLKSKYEIFFYTGDESQFRMHVSRDSTYILNDIKARTSKRSLVFVDEVQKNPDILDALKIVFDQGHSVIVSGSNPQFLSTEAKIRMQRRADFFQIQTFSLPEILLHKKHIDEYYISPFFKILTEDQFDSQFIPKVSVSDETKEICNSYLKTGGFPLSYLANNEQESMEEIKLVVERGFEIVLSDTHNIGDIVAVDLAKYSSQEFSYQGIFQRTGLTKRDSVNDIILKLINHGYLIQKKPLFPHTDRRSYLSVYSYVDPGIISYLTGDLGESTQEGHKIEGVVHARLKYLQQFIPLKTELGYFKPYIVDVNGKTKFKDGEIDFLFIRGKRILPIEVKASFKPQNINVEHLLNFIHEYKCKFGVVLYGGAPFFDSSQNLLFWPYWLV